MDAYPPDYALHNLPFIVLSGLNTNQEPDAPPPVQHVLPGRATTTINSELPPVTGELAQLLLHEFHSADGSDAPWNARGMKGRGNTPSFRIRTVGREFKLPPRKADSPSQSRTTPPSSPTVVPSYILHSPISPLSPGSSVFPDGLMTPAWIAKHQSYVPSVFISFFTFDSDPNRDSFHDNQLKTEITKIKGQILKSDYRTRFAVVLVSDESVLQSPDIEERLANIRRATGLDPKNSLFFLPPTASQGELRTFVNSLLSVLQPICIEYYRELTKHSRRKKARGAAPPPTAPPTRGAFHPLSQSGWNVRYDFKLGVFAEFRQEMDAAQRHYGIALDALFGSDGIFETTASWSPRWDETRLLADIVALRLIRCQLWNAYPTSAVQSWLRYKNRMRDLVDRRGKGSSNYGWEAWESRWAQIMAHLIQRAELPIFRITQLLSGVDPLLDRVNPIFSLPEKQFPIGERLPPWELLHHPGYWYKMSADHAKRRYAFAREIPEEDRTPPGMSPATKVSSRNQTYDTYLVPEPHIEMPLNGALGGVEHWKDIVGKLNGSIPEFEARGQLRKVEQLRLEVSKTLLHAQQYEEAFMTLRPLWESMSWRREGWWNLASEVVWALHECALRVQDRETYVLTEWELYSPVFGAKSRYKHDLIKCLDTFPADDSPSSKPCISFNTRLFESCLAINFCFAEGEGNVGEPLYAQITITSTARPGTASVTLSTITFQFKGCLGEVVLSHVDEDAPGESKVSFTDITLEETFAAPQKPCWRGSADLLISAGQTNVFSFPIIFREAGEVEAVASIFEINADNFDLIGTDNDVSVETLERPIWFLHAGSRLKPRKLNREFGGKVKVLPKPPKMEILLPDVRSQYYTDEPITLAIEVLNKEEEETEAVIEVRLLARAEDTIQYSWMDRGASSPMKEVSPPTDESSEVDLPGHVIGRLAQGARITERIQFDAPSEASDYALEVKVLYHLLSDRDIPISKTISVDLIFNPPFEAKFELIPCLHPDPWPSYFNVPEAEKDSSKVSSASGIAQKWSLASKIASFAEDELLLKSVTIDKNAVHGGAVCTITNDFDEAECSMVPLKHIERSFYMDIQKLSLEERRSTGLDLSMRLTWQRAGSPGNPIVTSSLPIPRITTPSVEPRVLASAQYSAHNPNMVHMIYTLENPTMHFLTFDLSMEASDEFGFAGPKVRSLHLLPMSRQTVTYNLYALETEVWMTPLFRVVDRYFNQTLKPEATKGLRAGKKGVSVWVPGDEGKGPVGNDAVEG